MVVASPVKPMGGSPRSGLCKKSAFAEDTHGYLPTPLLTPRKLPGTPHSTLEVTDVAEKELESHADRYGFFAGLYC